VNIFLAALLLLILPATGHAQKPWKFIVTCDSRGPVNGVQPIILGELVNEILDQSVDFVLFPGDLVAGYASIGPAGFEAELWTWVDMMLPVYKADIGVYVSRGNHEVMDVWGYTIRPDINPYDNHATRWLNVFGNDLYPEQKLPDNGPRPEKYMTYAVTHKNAFIVSLDQYAGINHETVHMVNQKWLDAQLAVNTKPHIFVAGHEPAFRALHTDCLDNRLLVTTISMTTRALTMVTATRTMTFTSTLSPPPARRYTHGHHHTAAITVIISSSKSVTMKIMDTF